MGTLGGSGRWWARAEAAGGPGMRGSTLPRHAVQPHAASLAGALDARPVVPRHCPPQLGSRQPLLWPDSPPGPLACAAASPWRCAAPIKGPSSPCAARRWPWSSPARPQLRAASSLSGGMAPKAGWGHVGPHLGVAKAVALPPACRATAPAPPPPRRRCHTAAATPVLLPPPAEAGGGSQEAEGGDRRRQHPAVLRQAA